MFWEELYIRLNKRKLLQQYLHKFLVLHRMLSIPQLGSFIIEEEPAQIDVASGLLFAPRSLIRFSTAVQPVSDKVFFHFLSEELGVDEVTAIREFHEYCYAFRNDLQQGMAVLPGVGRMVRREEGELLFTPESQLLELLPPVPWTDTTVTRQSTKKKAAAAAEKELPGTVVMTESSEEIIPRDRWWIYAILLLAAGVLALLFYYQ